MLSSCCVWALLQLVSCGESVVAGVGDKSSRKWLVVVVVVAGEGAAVPWAWAQ